MNQNIAYLAQYTALNMILDTLAAAGRTLSYGRVAKLLGMQARSSTFFALLGQTMSEDHAAKRPLRCTLVVRDKTGLPGPAYFQLIQGYGYDIHDSEQRAFHDLMKERVFAAA